MTPNHTSNSKQRGDPFDARARRSRSLGLQAARTILTDEGVSALTHARVAEVSGLHRATIYRHWPTVIELLLDVTTLETAAAMPPITGETRRDLAATLRALRDELVDGFGRFLATLFERAEFDEALRTAKLDIGANGLSSLRQIVEGATQRGELPANLDAEVAVAQLFGPILYRRFLSSEAISDGYLDEIIETFLNARGTDRSTDRIRDEP